MQNTTISSNDISRPWVGLSALEGGEISFLDSLFVANRNVAVRRQFVLASVQSSHAVKSALLPNEFLTELTFLIPFAPYVL